MRTTHRILILCALLATTASADTFSEPAQADDSITWLGISGLSWHTDRSKPWREQNPGFSIERRKLDSDVSWVAGYDRNSYNRPNAYIGTVWQPIHIGPARIGAWAAVATGYKYHVIASLAASVEGERVGFNVIASPAVGKHSGFIGAQLKVRLP